jgi:hypothetical protein
MVLVLLAKFLACAIISSIDASENNDGLNLSSYSLLNVYEG